MITNRFVFLTGIFFLLFLTACDKKTDNSANFQRAPLPIGNIEGVIVSQQILKSDISASGSLLPFEQTELHSEVPGRVISINLPEGKRVSKGTLLVKIFDEDLQTQLRKLDAQLSIARTTTQRLKGLLDVKGTSQQEYDLSELQIKNIEAEMDLLRVRIRQTEVRAPFDGVIGLRQISNGAYITSTTPIATIRDDRKLKLDFSVPEKYGALIHNGQTIHFKLDGSDRTYSALVNASEQSVDAATRDLRLRAIVSEHSNELTPGRFAEVQLTLSTRPKAIMVPTQAVIPQAKDKKVVVSKNGKAVFTTVTTGIRQEGLVEITEGLMPGDTIVTAGMLFLRPDAAIQFSKIQ